MSTISCLCCFRLQADSFAKAHTCNGPFGPRAWYSHHSLRVAPLYSNHIVLRAACPPPPFSLIHASVHSFFGLTLKVLCGILDLCAVNIGAISIPFTIIIPLMGTKSLSLSLSLSLHLQLNLKQLPAMSNLPFSSIHRAQHHLFWILGAAIFRFNIVGAVQPDLAAG